MGVAPIVVVIASVVTFSVHMILGYDLTAAQVITCSVENTLGYVAAVAFSAKPLLFVTFFTLWLCLCGQALPCSQERTSGGCDSSKCTLACFAQKDLSAVAVLTFPRLCAEQPLLLVV